MIRAAIVGTGHHVPERVVTNDELTRYMDTSDEWIRERSGIHERHWVEPGTRGTDLAATAARRALAAAGLEPAEIDFIIFATINPDYTFPGNGVLLQEELGMPTVGAMDIRNQCTGFVYGLAAADAFVRAGQYRNVLLLGAEIHSTGLDLSTAGRDVSVLFGDGAGAVVVQAVEDPDRGVLASCLHSQGRFHEELSCEMPSAMLQGRVTHEVLDQGRHFPRMEGRTVFQHAIKRFCEAIREVLAAGGHEIGDVDLLVPHQANQRITEMVAKRMGVPMERVMSNIHKYGNTTAATIPIALDEAVSEGRLKRGDLVVTVAFGSGFTWGANLIRW